MRKAFWRRATKQHRAGQPGAGGHSKEPVSEERVSSTATFNIHKDSGEDPASTHQEREDTHRTKTGKLPHKRVSWLSAQWMETEHSKIY